MATKTTRWKPDTCECVLEYEWDIEDMNPNRTHTLKKIVTACPEHTGLTPAQAYSAIKGENTTKNQFLKELLDNSDTLRKQEVDAEGSPAGFALADGLKYEWSFKGTGANRTLDVEITGKSLTQNEKTTVEQVISQKFPGKVNLLD